MTNRRGAWAGLPGVEELRQRAHEIRMAVIDDLDGHVARFTAALEARGGHVYFAAHRGGGERVRRGRLPEAGREARGEVEVDGDGRDRAERGARGGRRHGRRDRPRRVHPPARRRASRAHRRAGDREDRRAGRGAALGGRRRAGAARARGADERGADAAPPDVPRGGGRASPARTSAVSETGSICLVTNEGNAPARQLAAAACTSRSWGWSGSCRTTRRPRGAAASCWRDRAPARRSRSTRRS